MNRRLIPASTVRSAATRAATRAWQAVGRAERKGWPIALVAAVALACQTDSNSPPRPAAEAPPAPQAPVLESSTAAVQAASPYDRAAEYSEARGGRALLVMEGDRVVFASGQNGFPITRAHPIHGATESFWGPLAIVAESEGLLDLDEPVRYTIEEFEDEPPKRDMRIRQLLSYTSGLEGGLWALQREKPSNHYARSLSLSMVAAPGERFQFGPSHLAVFGEALRRILEEQGLDPLDYLQARIFDPIGLKVADWQRDAEGNPDLASGASLAAHEWARYGVLLRDRGRWQGKAIIDSTQLAACFEGSDAEPGFGLTLWLNPAGRPSHHGAAREPPFGEGLADLVAATGSGNQRLFAIASLDLVVVRFGEADRRWSDREFLAHLVAGRRHPPRGAISRSAPNHSISKRKPASPGRSLALALCS